MQNICGYPPPPLPEYVRYVGMACRIACSFAYSIPLTEPNCVQVQIYKTTSTVNSSAAPAERIWSVERQCAMTCDPGCLTVGERTKIIKCVSCCSQDLCNFGDGAATSREAGEAVFWVALLSLWLVAK